MYLVYFDPLYGKKTVISHIMTMLPVQYNTIYGSQCKSVFRLTVSLPGMSLFTHSCTVKMAPARLRKVLCDAGITYIIDYRDPDVKTNKENMNTNDCLKFRW